MAVSGTHGLDKSIDYNVTMDVPAKYLGGEITKLLQKLDPKEANLMSVALPIVLKGTFNNPQVSLNAENAINKLTQELIAKQKDKLINQGTDILSGILGGGTKTDSTSTNTQKQDTIQQNSQQQNTQQQNTKVIKDILGGILGGKKKKQDTIKAGN